MTRKIYILPYVELLCQFNIFVFYNTPAIDIETIPCINLVILNKLDLNANNFICFVVHLSVGRVRCKGRFDRWFNCFITMIFLVFDAEVAFCFINMQSS